MAQHVPEAAALRIKDERLSWCVYLCLGRDGGEEDYLCVTQGATQRALSPPHLSVNSCYSVCPGVQRPGTPSCLRKTLLKKTTPPDKRCELDPGRDEEVEEVRGGG